MISENAKFETTEAFFSLHVSTWKDFYETAQYWKQICYTESINCLQACMSALFSPNILQAGVVKGLKARAVKGFLHRAWRSEYCRLFHLLPGILPLLSNFWHLMSFSFRFLSADPFQSASCFCLQIPFSQLHPFQFLCLQIPFSQLHVSVCRSLSVSFMFLSADPFHLASCFCLQIPFNQSVPWMNCISSWHNHHSWLGVQY